MVQGGLKKKSTDKKDAAPKKIHSRKQHENSLKKYNQFVKPKEGFRLEQFKSSQQVTKMINRNIEKFVAGKVIQAGEKFGISNLQAKGKDHVKEIKRLALKGKKKTGIEEKLKKLQSQLDNGEAVKGVKVKGFLTDEIINRASSS
jgi:hypothetical protein